MRVSFRIAAIGLLGVLSVLSGLRGIQAQEAPAAVDPILSDVMAELRVNDPRWIDRIIVNFAAALGLDPAPINSVAAKCLYRCRSFDGIDLTRPAWLAWRKGPAPLLAIIPLSDRRAFLASFGTGLGDDAPLIRIGERDGTIVYSQNGNDGLIEYRLEVSDSAAFLARNAKECRALFTHVPVALASDAPLVLRASSDYLQKMTDPAGQLATFLQLPGDQNHLVRLCVEQLLSRAWSEITPQVSDVLVELRAQGESDARLVVTGHAKPETSLAVWLGNQRNQPSRMVGAVHSPNSLVTVAGSIAWQGLGQKMGDLTAQTLRSDFAGKWNAPADELWRSIWAIAERNGPFAASLDVDSTNGQLTSEWRLLVEQPRAYDLVGVVNTFVQTLSGVPGEALTLPGASGFRQAGSGLVIPAAADVVSLASDHAVAMAQASAHDPEQVANDLLQRSQAVLPVDSPKCLVAATINLTPLVAVVVQLLGGLAPLALGEVRMLSTVSCTEGSFVMETALPLHGIAKLLRDGGLMLYLNGSH